MRKMAVVVRADVAARVHRLVATWAERAAGGDDTADLRGECANLRHVETADEGWRVVFLGLDVVNEEGYQPALFIEADRQTADAQL